MGIDIFEKILQKLWRCHCHIRLAELLWKCIGIFEILVQLFFVLFQLGMVREEKRFVSPSRQNLLVLRQTDNKLGECFKFVINMHGCLSKVNT